MLKLLSLFNIVKYFNSKHKIFLTKNRSFLQLVFIFPASIAIFVQLLSVYVILHATNLTQCCKTNAIWDVAK